MSDAGKYGTMPGLTGSEPDPAHPNKQPPPDPAQRLVDEELAKISEMTVYRVSADEPLTDGNRAEYFATRGEAEEAHEALSAGLPEAEFDAIEPITVRNPGELAKALNDAITYGDA